MKKIFILFILTSVITLASATAGIRIKSGEPDDQTTIQIVIQGNTPVRPYEYNSEAVLDQVENLEIILPTQEDTEVDRTGSNISFSIDTVDGWFVCPGTNQWVKLTNNTTGQSVRLFEGETCMVEMSQEGTDEVYDVINSILDDPSNSTITIYYREGSTEFEQEYKVSQ